LSVGEPIIQRYSEVKTAGAGGREGEKRAQELFEIAGPGQGSMTGEQVRVP
jgi:hypothetical protein